MRRKTMPEWTPLNIRAFFTTEFGICGCAETDEVVKTAIGFLTWCGSDGMERQRYDELYADAGLFYFMAGAFDRVGMTEEGTSMRCIWLSNDGKIFLDALKSFPPEEIDIASGEAYDGCWYE